MPAKKTPAKKTPAKISKSAPAKTPKRAPAKSAPAKTAKKSAPAKSESQRTSKAAPARSAAAKAKPKRVAELKTKVTGASVDVFLSKIDASRRDDCRAIDAMLRRVVGEPGRMWGSAIVGYGTYRYTYPSGRVGDWMLTGFSPRKQNLTLYVMSGFDGEQALLAKLGPCSTGKSCLYLKRLADIDLGVLEKLVTKSVAHMRKLGSAVS